MLEHPTSVFTLLSYVRFSFLRSPQYSKKIRDLQGKCVSFRVVQMGVSGKAKAFERTAMKSYKHAGEWCVSVQVEQCGTCTV